MPGDWDGWDDQVIAGPGEAFFFMGADPAWTPDREPVGCDGHPAPPPGICPSCGSDGKLVPGRPVVFCMAAGFLPVEYFPVLAWAPGKVRDGSPTYCATCGRWGRDDLVVEAMARDIHHKGYVGPSVAGPKEIPGPTAPALPPHYRVIRSRWKD
jgi:hypothetical protein